MLDYKRAIIHTAESGITSEASETHLLAETTPNCGHEFPSGATEGKYRKTA